MQVIIKKFWRSPSFCARLIDEFRLGFQYLLVNNVDVIGASECSDYASGPEDETCKVHGFSPFLLFVLVESFKGILQDLFKLIGVSAKDHGAISKTLQNFVNGIAIPC